MVRREVLLLLSALAHPPGLAYSVNLAGMPNSLIGRVFLPYAIVDDLEVDEKMRN